MIICLGAIFYIERPLGCSCCNIFLCQLSMKINYSNLLLVVFGLLILKQMNCNNLTLYNIFGFFSNSYVLQL